MSQLQDTLPFKHLSAFSFEQYTGNESVVNALNDPDKLPQFSYLWGESFTGKTHLLGAFEALLKLNARPTLLLDSLVLKQVDVTSILADDLQFLLLEDVDLLMSDHAGELALFNLFNYCKNNSIKLVVSSLVHPKDNAWQLPDLISRLNSGLTYALEPLNGSDAMTCIAKQFSLNGMTLDKTVIHYLQTHYSSSYPALFRLFLSVSTQSLKLKRKVTVPLIKQAIKDSES